MRLFEELKLLPNQITLIRIVLIPFLVYFAYREELVLFLVLYIIASLSDLFDGLAARKMGISSEFGSIFDASADMLLVFTMIPVLYFLAPAILSKYLMVIGVIIAMALVRILIVAIKFKGKAALHLYTGKASMVALFFGMLLLLLTGIDYLIVCFLVLVILDLIEEIAIMLTRATLDLDTKSIFLK